MSRVMDFIVKDYNGHLRIDQADLDALETLGELRVQLTDERNENETLRETIRRLSKANGNISAELNETRWALLRANEKIEKLQSIEVSYETVPEEVTV